MTHPSPITPPPQCPACGYDGHEGEDDDGIVFDMRGRCWHSECDVFWWEHRIAELEARVEQPCKACAAAVHNIAVDYTAKNRVAELEELVTEWQCASGLSKSGPDGDSDGITPADLEKYLMQQCRESATLRAGFLASQKACLLPEHRRAIAAAAKLVEAATQKPTTQNGDST